MTPDEATLLAARILVAIDRDRFTTDHLVVSADRERVASDIAGLRECYVPTGVGRVRLSHDGIQQAHARRYAEGLRRTASLYGVDPGASS